MVSSVCQRLLNKQWKLYNVGDVPQIEGIYLIGRTDPEQDTKVLYVGRSNDVHRRLVEHRRQDLAIDNYVREQVQLNRGEDLRIKWIHEENTNQREKKVPRLYCKQTWLLAKVQHPKIGFMIKLWTLTSLTEVNSNFYA